MIIRSLLFYRPNVRGSVPVQHGVRAVACVDARLPPDNGYQSAARVVRVVPSRPPMHDVTLRCVQQPTTGGINR